jgi:cytochrome P450
MHSEAKDEAGNRQASSSESKNRIVGQIVENAMPIESRVIPDHVPADHVLDFNFYRPEEGPAAADDIHATWRNVQAQAAGRLMWSPYNGGHWIATSAEDIKTIFSDSSRFSSSSILIPRGEFSIPVLPQEADPPHHEHYRSVIMPWFSPKRILALGEQVKNLATELIDTLAPRGSCEFIDEFARPFPTAIIMTLVDLPLKDRAYLQKLTDDQTRHPNVGCRSAAFEESIAYLAEIVDARRSCPGEDLISHIVHARIDGCPMSQEEVLGLVFSLVAGGLDTVTAVLGHVTYFLANNPSSRRAILESPEDIANGNGVEELLRRFAVATPARSIAHDMEYRGLILKAGELIQVPTFLYNFDERRFARPMAVDLARQEGPSGTFGFGRHRCVGANLARLELRVFLQEWLARIPNFEITAGAKVTFEGGLTVAVSHLPLVWQTRGTS